MLYISSDNSLTPKKQAHAQVATLHYLSAPTSLPTLSMSLRHFARAIELNDAYLRGYYGLKLISQTLIPLLSSSSSSSEVSKRNAEDDEVTVAPPKLQSVQKLEQLATAKLAEIVRLYGAGKKEWSAFDEAEVIAARKLLDRDGGKVER